MLGGQGPHGQCESFSVQLLGHDCDTELVRLSLRD